MLLSSLVPAGPVQAAALERGTAVTDPLALRELDRGRLNLARVISPASPHEPTLTNTELFALPSMAPVRRAIDSEFDRYVARHTASLPNESIGVGEAFAFRLFDRSLLYATDTRFVLAGIVNRMDRAYVSPGTCGEIRLIYRLARMDEAHESSSRLPMTLSLVLRAKGEKAQGTDMSLTCKEIARRWLSTADWPEGGTGLAARLTSPGGPLEFVASADVDRIEANLQIAHAPKSAVRDFRTDYLLKTFRYIAQTGLFEESALENQIDRQRILADDHLKRDFKAWLLDSRNLGEFDRGTLLIPQKFLAIGAIAPTPVGFDSSELQPEFGFVQNENSPNALFAESDIVDALKRAADNGEALRNIRSVAGFERRLNDVTCSGCHQTRGIGGFHFPGVDWMAAKPSNSTVVPASPHFFGDQVRRRDILTATRDGGRPDYSRGFSSRPQLRGSKELDGTEYNNGWGAHCYQPGEKAADMSFAGWSCAEGLACQVAGKTSRMGMCFVESR